MPILTNPYRKLGLPAQPGLATGPVLSDPAGPQALLAHCPAARPTPLQQYPEIAKAHALAAVHVKDERARMGLGSFKALGAAYAIARIAAERAGGGARLADHPQRTTLLSERIFACASAGNHGLSVAAGARLFGARAIIYLADTVPEPFIARLKAFGAEVRRAGTCYEDSMAAAEADCRRNGWTLLSDSSWPGYVELPTRVMEGYLTIAAEVVAEIDMPPSHIFLQAGVGGFAAAMIAHFRSRWGDAPSIVVVEPDSAATLLESVRAGRPVTVTGPSSIMGRLDCKAPSHLALGELARNADIFLTITDRQCAAAVDDLGALGVPTTPSGAAGLAAVLDGDTRRLVPGLNSESRVLAFVTEGPESAT